MRAAALTVDLKNSRKLAPERRTQVQRYMIRAAEAVNKIFADNMLRELCFNGGDEMQALLRGPAEAFLCLRLLRRLLLPLELHAGVGVGEWETRIKDRNSFYQDGSAYHRAREAVELSKRDRDSFAFLIWDDEIAPAAPRVRAWNAILNGTFQLTERNTPYQNETALLLECLFPIYVPTASEKTLLLWYTEQRRELVRLMRSSEAESVFGADRPNARRPLVAVSEQFTQAESDAAFQSFVSLDEWEQAHKKEAAWFYQEAHPYGAASAVAAAAGLTRQAVDTALRASKVYAERALAMALWEELSEAWEEPDRD